MPTKRRRRKERRGELDYDGFWELLLGPGGHKSVFESPEARRTAWFTHRVQLLSDSGDGQRPWAYWEHEARQHPDRRIGEDDAELLVRLGVADPGDLEEFCRRVAFRDGVVRALQEIGNILPEDVATHKRRLALVKKKGGS